MNKIALPVSVSNHHKGDYINDCNGNYVHLDDIAQALNQPVKKCKWRTKSQSLLDAAALTGCDTHTKVFSSNFIYCPYCGGEIEL